MGIPGSVSPLSGRIRNANSTWLNGQPLGKDLEAILGQPVSLANDANCLALSESVDGAGQNASTMFAVILGTGVGGGLCVNGKIITGANGIAGEWGHTLLGGKASGVLAQEPCWCGKYGCIETHLSGPALVRAYHQTPQSDPTVSLQLEGVDLGPILQANRQVDTHGARQRVLKDLLFEALGVDKIQDWGRDHKVTWRGTDRVGHIRFGNVRKMGPELLRCPDDHAWRLIVDYPFDDAGFGPHNDEAQLDEFREKLARQLAQTVNREFRQSRMVGAGTGGSASDALPDLSDTAKHLLSEAARDSKGYIFFCRSMTSLTVQTNGKQLAEAQDARSEARWRAAMDELVRGGLLEARGVRGEVFAVTRAGFDLADRLAASPGQP